MRIIEHGSPEEQRWAFANLMAEVRDTWPRHPLEHSPRAELCQCKQPGTNIQIYLGARLRAPEAHHPTCAVYLMDLRLWPEMMPDQLEPWVYDEEQLGYRCRTTTATGFHGRIVLARPQPYFVRGFGSLPFADSERGRWVWDAFCRSRRWHNFSDGVSACQL